MGITWFSRRREGRSVVAKSTERGGGGGKGANKKLNVNEGTNFNVTQPIYFSVCRCILCLVSVFSLISIQFHLTATKIWRY